MADKRCRSQAFFSSHPGATKLFEASTQIVSLTLKLTSVPFCLNSFSLERERERREKEIGRQFAICIRVLAIGFELVVFLT